MSAIRKKVTSSTPYILLPPPQQLAPILGTLTCCVLCSGPWTMLHRKVDCNCAMSMDRETTRTTLREGRAGEMATAYAPTTTTVRAALGIRWQLKALGARGSAKSCSP